MISFPTRDARLPQQSRGCSRVCGNVDWVEQLNVGYRLKSSRLKVSRCVKPCRSMAATSRVSWADLPCTASPVANDSQRSKIPRSTRSGGKSLRQVENCFVKLTTENLKRFWSTGRVATTQNS
jgi:hypothetical protein